MNILGNIERNYERLQDDYARVTAQRNAAEVHRDDLMRGRDGEIRRLREQLAGAVEALERIAEPTVSDPIHREYPSVKRLQGIAQDALTALGEYAAPGDYRGAVSRVEALRRTQHPADPDAGTARDIGVWNQALDAALTAIGGQ